MPNCEWERLTPVQAAAVERCIDAVREAGGYCDEAGGAYAYEIGSGRIAWGLNNPDNVLRGVVRR